MQSSSPWHAEQTVAGFASSPPNEILVGYAAAEGQRAGVARLLDLGCGAGRNAVPLAQGGWRVAGIDTSKPMLDAMRRRALDEDVSDRVAGHLARMDALPFRDRSFQLVVAHGIWNLARSGAEFRAAVREAARVSTPGAGLFLFTFSRNTLSPDAAPVPGEAFVFTQFSGQPQCFLTETQLLDELAAAGFSRDPAVPLSEYNLPRPGAVRAGKVPVIYEVAFRRTG